MIVAVKMLTDAQRKQIAAQAEKYGFEIRFFETEEEAAGQVQDAEVIFSGFPGLAKEAPALRWLSTPYAGAEDFLGPDIFASDKVILTNSSGAYGVTISEHIIMVLIEILRKQQTYAKHIENKQWVRKLPVRSIFGSRITLAGTGNIGQETVKRLRSFSPEKIIGLNRRGENPDGLFDEVFTIDQIEKVLPETEILILSLPGTEQTRSILNKELLGKLPDDAVIVNVGRGNCIDEAALNEELRKQRLYAALDVFVQEPLPDDSPLWDCPDLLITPHVAGDLTLPYTRQKIVDMFLENLERYCENRPLLRQVDRTFGY